MRHEGRRGSEVDLTFTLRSAAVSVVAKQKRLRSGRMQRCAPPGSHVQVSCSRAALISFPSPGRPEAPRPCDRGARACSDGRDEPVPSPSPRPGQVGPCRCTAGARGAARPPGGSPHDESDAGFRITGASWRRPAH
jgi:hypothetical protein